MAKATGGTFVVLFVLVLALTSCAGPEPVLKSNKQLQLYGREKARQEIDVCRRKVEAAGVGVGVHQTGNAATGAVLGMTLGGAVGASAGVIGGFPGIAIGAASGAGLGLVIGLVGGTFKPLVPDPPYADAVAKCLTEKGYEVSGWDQ